MGYKQYEIFKFVGDTVVLGTETFNDIVVEYEVNGFMYKEFNKNGTFLGIQIGLPFSGEEFEVKVVDVKIDGNSVNFDDEECSLILAFYDAVYDIDNNGEIVLLENKQVKDKLDAIYFSLKGKQ